MSEKIMLLDGNSLINRAFYAIPLLTNSKGEFTNAVYGFMNIFYKLFDDEKPDCVVVAFDLPKPTFRHQMFEEYKGTRKGMPEELKGQFPVLKSLLIKMGIAVCEKEGFEADDILGTLSCQAEEIGIDAVIVSGDRDLLQCATEKVKIRIPKTKAGKTETEDWFSSDVVEKLGVTPKEFINVKALMGDSSDNIPGVPGIGEKTAYKIIQEYKTLENAIENAEKITPKRASANLEEFKEQARLSLKLAEINVCAPISIDVEAARVSDIYSNDAREEIAQLGFKSLLSRFPEPTVDESTVIVMSEDMVSYALNTDGLASLTIFNGKESTSAFFNEAELKSFFEAETKKITSDAKKDIVYLNERGIELENLMFDTMIADYILGNEPRNLDAENAWKAYSSAKEKIFANRQEFLYYEIEMPLVRVLADMETCGIKVDEQALKAYGTMLGEKIMLLQASIYALAGAEFNINSPKQLGVVLFETLGLKGGKKKKTGYSTAADVLEKLAGEHPIINEILEYRTYSKLKSTYVDGLLQVMDKQTGKIHSTFKQTIASTGRLSSTEPNLQNIPVRTELGRQLRKVFIPSDPDFVFLDADYSQIELRILAHLSGDEMFIKAFCDGDDIHTMTASQVLKILPEEVTAEQRRSAKSVNFGIVYGIGAFSLSNDIGVSVKEAEKYIEGYFAKYPKVKEYLDNSVKTARENGYAETIFGRRRAIPEIMSENFVTRSFGERAAMNMPVQGAAADIIKIAMIRVSAALKNGGFKSRLILQVHDELLLEVFKPELDAVTELVKKEMEGAAELSVPLSVDVSVGDNWMIK